MNDKIYEESNQLKLCSESPPKLHWFNRNLRPIELPLSNVVINYFTRFSFDRLTRCALVHDDIEVAVAVR